MDKIYISAFFLSICTIGKATAQTVNNGELVVRSGTVMATVSSFNNNTSGDFINDGTFILYANYNNDGLVSFTPKTSTGLTYFKGLSGAQTISGTILSELNNVHFENKNVQPAFLLSGDISIAGVSEFDKGIVDNVNYNGNIIFESDASHKSTSNNSYVSGYVERAKNKAFQFPIGDGGFFRPSSIGQINSQDDFFRSKYLLKDSDPQYPHNQRQKRIQLIDNVEYWELESSQKNIDLALTLSWNEETTPNTIINGERDSELAIVRWDATDNEWKFYTTAVDVSNKLATAAVKDQGIYTLARILSEMPDNIVVYNAVSANGDGLNEYFRIDGLEDFPDNTLQIFNRWGVKVYETSGYGVNNNVFKGYSEGRVTVNKGEKLPTGTYFYVLTYKGLKSGKEKTGYLYVN
ncbi:gliding motility-associated C-terminal domain-containing protein [Flavobacterium sp. N2038]|uniref:gliding motility-associated C-terminal domain-containing protein n=1 Tax=Flavobacterium sp. N2038 TaxID=2986829 RepID=UPI0022240322|nr:gliding motility-associated C-terminal domain-containing protein [Flavobacterium sp. N2038]